MVAGDEALCLEYVGTELVDVACCTGEVAGGLYAAAHGAGLHFESVYVVGLPTVEAQVEVLHLLQHLLGVDTNFCVALFRYFVSLLDECLFHIV